MIIAGFHATSKKNANKIMRSGFKCSNNSKDWLGKGIYFYPNIQDALEWKDSDTIICALIKIKPSELLDIDSYEGSRLYETAYNEIYNRFNKRNQKMKEDAQETQCAIMNLIWKADKNLKVIQCSFAKEKTKMATLHDIREKRKEFCIRSKSTIKKMYIIHKEDLK